CGMTCCNSGQICIRDASGNPTCATQCAISRDCPSAQNCCTPLEDSSGGLLGYGACVPYRDGLTCRCALPGDCTTHTCAPMLDRAGYPTPVTVCVANDGQPYHGCPSGC